jgi:hypothetical protein
MRFRYLMIAVAAVLAAAALTTTAVSEPPATEPTKPVEPQSCLVEEIARVFEAEQVALAGLRERLAAAEDEETYDAVMRETEAVKLKTQITIIELQIAHARETGQADQIRRLEAAVEALKTPPPRGVPQPRPAPESPAK